MSAVFEVVIGLMTVFLLFAIVVSGVNEWLAQLSSRRGQYLRLGLQRLLNDEAVYRRVLHHPLIGSLYRERAAKGKPPSYIDPENFAMALADVLLARAGANRPSQNAAPQLSVQALRAALQSPALVASPIAGALGPIFDRAGNDLEAALRGMQSWFHSSMDRVSGWYKNRTRKVLFAVGLTLAALCNVDAIEIAEALNHSSFLRASFLNLARDITSTGKVGDVDIASLSSRAPTEAEWKSVQPVLETLRKADATGLPIGYACLGATSLSDPTMTAWSACSHEIRETLAGRSISSWLMKFLGWVLTAAAGTLGAGYWFGLLTKAINIRGSGPKPDAPARVPAAGAS